MKRPSLRNILLLVVFTPNLATAQQHKFDGENTFAQYTVPEVFKGKPAPLDLSSPDARMYRTRLRYAIAKGPKFAGYYAVATWGCGTGCISAAIVDLRTGKVTFFPATIQEWFVGRDLELSQLTYKLHSRAWHVVGDLNERDDPADRWYV